MHLASAVATDAQSAASVAWLVVVLCGVAALLALFLAAVASVIRSPRLTTAGRAAWVLAVLVFPLLGPVVWFAVGRKSSAQIYRSPA